MFEHLLTLLPRQPGTITLVLAVLGSLTGMGFWLAGARFSRSVLTLAAVALGTAVGMNLPRWCGWSVDGMGPAVGAALILGVSGWVLHRLWVGLWLGAVLAAWIILAVWTATAADTHWRWPAYDAAQMLPKYLAALWQSLPDPPRQILGFSALAAMAGGILTAVVWPRIGMVVMWSAAGVSLAFATAATALSRFDPQALRHLPRQASAQWLLLGGLVAAGAFIQWSGIPAANAYADADAGADAADETGAESNSGKVKHSKKRPIAD